MLLVAGAPRAAAALATLPPAPARVAMGCGVLRWRGEHEHAQRREAVMRCRRCNRFDSRFDSRAQASAGSVKHEDGDMGSRGGSRARGCECASLTLPLVPAFGSRGAWRGGCGGRVAGPCAKPPPPQLSDDAWKPAPALCGIHATIGKPLLHLLLHVCPSAVTQPRRGSQIAAADPRPSSHHHQQQQQQ